MGFEGGGGEEEERSDSVEDGSEEEEEGVGPEEVNRRDADRAR